MKKTIVVLACCALFAPLAFAQTKLQPLRRNDNGKPVGSVTESAVWAAAIISRPEPLLFVRTARIKRAAMFSTGPSVTLWTKPRDASNNN